MDTSIQGASNLLINTCGKVNIVDLNEAISHVRELAGDHVNIIWGTVSAADFDEEKIVVTLIATGMDEKVAVPKMATDTNISPIKVLPVEPMEWKSKHTKPTTPPKSTLVIPSFLLNPQKNS